MLFLLVTAGAAANAAAKAAESNSFLADRERCVAIRQEGDGAAWQRASACMDGVLPMVVKHKENASLIYYLYG